MICSGVILAEAFKLPEDEEGDKKRPESVETEAEDGELPLN